MRIKLNINKNKNLLYLLYVLNKPKFDDMQSKENFKALFKAYNLSKENCDKIKELLKTDKGQFKSKLNSHKEILIAFKENEPLFKEYWNNNIHSLRRIRDKLYRMNRRFDKEKLRCAANFYQFNLDKLSEIEVLLFMGNTDNIGRAFFNDKNVVLFARNFIGQDKEDISRDFKVVIHEIVHLFDKSARTLISKELEERGINIMEFFEFLARGFAPRGIIFEQSDNCEEYVRVIDKAIKRDKDLIDIKGDLITALKPILKQETNHPISKMGSN